MKRTMIICFLKLPLYAQVKNPKETRSSNFIVSSVIQVLRKSLIKASNSFLEDRSQIMKLIDNVSHSCKVCLKYRKPRPRPIVGLPMSSEFNQCVALDLVQLSQSLWFIHIIDTFIRFSSSKLTKTKDKDVITDIIFEIWLARFGQPRKFLADNGGEFINKVYEEMCEQFNIEFSTKAAKRPWSNGLCERHNGIIKEMLSKIIEDTKYTPNRALFWAISAKNSLSNNNGCSPNQLVFGKNYDYPCILTDYSYQPMIQFQVKLWPITLL